MGGIYGLKVGARLKICAAATTSALTLVGATATVVQGASARAGSFDFFTFDCPARGTVTSLNGINDHGDFAGTCYGPTFIYGFLVRNGHFIKVVDPATGPSGCRPCTEVSYMNASDTIVGVYFDKARLGHGFIRDVAGNYTTIDDPKAGTSAAAGAGTYPEGINDRGVVVGNYVDNASVSHGFTWSQGVFRTLPNPPGMGTAAGQGEVSSDESTTGVIVGAYFTKADTSRGFVLTGGRFITFSAPHAGTGPAPQGTLLSGISNDASTIVGVATDADNVVHGFVLRSWRFTELDDPHAGAAPREGTFITAIDEDGDFAVGVFYDAHGRAHGMLVDLS